jgi:four helix bundle protein
VSRIERFEDLIAWQKARAFAGHIHKLVRAPGFSRDFKLRDQIWAAAISTMSNIAEGFERNRLREFHQFLSIAKASCAEVRSQLYLAYDAGYLDNQTLKSTLAEAEEVARIIGGLRKSVETQLQGAEPLRTQHSGLRT